MKAERTPDRRKYKALSSLAPVLQPGTLVFVSMFQNSVTDDVLKLAKATFVEDEGMSLILPRTEAVRLGLAFDATYRQITMMMNSKFGVLGLDATIGRELANEGIESFFINATNHPHALVPARQAEGAVEVLRELREKALRRYRRLAAADA